MSGGQERSIKNVEIARLNNYGLAGPGQGGRAKRRKAALAIMDSYPPSWHFAFGPRQWPISSAL